MVDRWLPGFAGSLISSRCRVVTTIRTFDRRYGDSWREVLKGEPVHAGHADVEFLIVRHLFVGDLTDGELADADGPPVSQAPLVVCSVAAYRSERSSYTVPVSSPPTVPARSALAPIAVLSLRPSVRLMSRASGYGPPRWPQSGGEMPQQAWNAKRERQYEHIKEGLEERGRPERLAEEIPPGQ